jgi:hypothetical protein
MKKLQYQEEVVIPKIEDALNALANGEGKLTVERSYVEFSKGEMLILLTYNGNIVIRADNIEIINNAYNEFVITDKKQVVVAKKIGKYTPKELSERIHRELRKRLLSAWV